MRREMGLLLSFLTLGSSERGAADVAAWTVPTVRRFGCLFLHNTQSCCSKVGWIHIWGNHVYLSDPSVASAHRSCIKGWIHCHVRNYIYGIYNYMPRCICYYLRLCSFHFTISPYLHLMLSLWISWLVELINDSYFTEITKVMELHKPMSLGQ